MRQSLPISISKNNNKIKAKKALYNPKIAAGLHVSWPGLFYYANKILNKRTI
jgi:hypothetical protein